MIFNATQPNVKTAWERGCVCVDERWVDGSGDNGNMHNACYTFSSVPIVLFHHFRAQDEICCVAQIINSAGAYDNQRNATQRNATQRNLRTLENRLLFNGRGGGGEIRGSVKGGGGHVMCIQCRWGGELCVCGGIGELLITCAMQRNKFHLGPMFI